MTLVLPVPYVDGRSRHRQRDRGRFRLGARTADIVATLWPERCKGLVSVSGYLIGNQAIGQLPLPPEASSSGGTSTTSPPSAGGRATTSTGATSRSSSGGLLHRSGTSTTPRLIAALRRSTIRITWDPGAAVRRLQLSSSTSEPDPRRGLMRALRSAGCFRSVSM